MGDQAAPWRGRDVGRGIFITLEGPDGSGKSSLSRRLADVLRDAGLDVVLTREPGGTRLGERIRQILLDATPALGHTGVADALLFSAARAQHTAEVIRPALERGALVVCDRYADSTLAYQGHGSGVPLDALRVVQQLATGGLRPDLTIILDLPVEVGLARKADEQTRFEADFDVAYHRRVRDGFFALAAAEPERFAVVDATADADRVLEAVLATLERLPSVWARLVASRDPRPGGGAPATGSGEGDRSRQSR